MVVKVENIIEEFSEDQHARNLAYNLPNGKAFEKKFNTTSNIYNLLKAIGVSIKTLYSNLNNLFKELNIETTNELITNFEDEFAIPDEQFSGSGTIAQRRSDVQSKMFAQGIQTTSDYENYFAQLGYQVEIIMNGNALGYYGWNWEWIQYSELPIGLGGHKWSDISKRRNRFWLVVKFSQVYDAEDLENLRLWMKKIAPANVFINFLT
jgi:uncharacterized protein YmfQ (DUF2313 family)